jgi:hypothetical protein
MSAKTVSRAFEEGRVKALRRMKQPIALLIVADSTPFNPVAKAMAQRRLSGAAGKHIRSQGAQRRADRMALQQMTRRADCGD